MTRSTALIIALVIAGGVVAALVLVNGGGGSGDTSTVAPVTAITTSTTPPTTTTSSRPDSVQVEATVTSYVSAADEGDATAVCNLQVDGQGSGATSAQACASKAGINLEQLPALSRLKVQDVKVEGDRATVSLGRYGEVTLVKSSGQWKVSGFKPASKLTAGPVSQTGSSGGSSGGSSSGTGGAERQDSGGTAAPSGTGGASAP